MYQLTAAGLLSGRMIVTVSNFPGRSWPMIIFPLHVRCSHGWHFYIPFYLYLSLGVTRQKDAHVGRPYGVAILGGHPRHLAIPNNGAIRAVLMVKLVVMRAEPLIGV